VISARTLLVPLVAGLLALTTALPADAAAAKPRPKKKASTFQAAPNFPESSMKLKVRGNPRAGSRVTLQVQGSNRVEDPDGYYLYAYVAPRSILKSCPQSMDNMRQFFINNDDVVGTLGTFTLGGGGYRAPITYRSGRARQVIYCVYVEWIIDGVGVGTLKHDFPRPTRKKR
jgi:hypothetical protein